MVLFPSLLPLLWGVAIAGASHPYEKVVQRDVVIIGGGSSGTYAAVQLLDKGQSVVVLEKKSQLGGHMVTYTDPDTHQPFNLGVIVFHDSPIVRNYFGRFGVALQKLGSGGGLTQEYVDFSTGRTVTGYQPVSQQALGAALQKYGQILASKYPYLSLGFDLPDPVPKELLAPYSEFIEANGLQDMLQLVNTIGGNIGNLLKRPTVYGIKNLSPLLLQALSAGFINAASGDNRDLYRGAETLLQQNDSVIYNTTIKSVRRSDHGVLVSINTPEGKAVITAKKLILAIPPVKENLEAIGLDMTPDEAELFGKFRSFLYGSAVLTHGGFDGTRVFTNIGANATAFNLPPIPAAYSFSPLIGKVATNKISTYYGALNPRMKESDIKQFIKNELDNLVKQGQIGPGTPDFKYFGDHAPFHIHVSAKDVGEGFYKKLYALEGKRSTFWTGAAFVDNDSTLIWTWSESYLLPLIYASLAQKS